MNGEVCQPGPLRVRGRELPFGRRTYLMGIINVTPDSFSGDGLLSAAHRQGRDGTPHGLVERAVALAGRMVDEGVDILDVGGESTRPGHEPIGSDEEQARVIEVVAAIRAALPDVLLSIDTSKADVAESALVAGADIVNDVAAVIRGAALATVAAAHRVPYILMHARQRPAEGDIVADVLAELEVALDQAEQAGCARDSLVVDPGIGFGKTAQQNLVLLRELRALRRLGRPVLLGASRKSTIGRVLDLPIEERLEGTLATTALGIAAGADIVRAHDVVANLRVARLSDAIVRGGWHDTADEPTVGRGKEAP